MLLFRSLIALGLLATSGAVSGPAFSARPPAPEELAVTAGPSTFLLCLPKGGTRREVRSKPRSCTTLGPLDSFAESVALARLRWRDWGNPVAQGRGIERGFHLPRTSIPVRVKVWRRRRVCGGDYLYTRLRSTSSHGSTTVRLPARCGDG
jgi:hypothetical protein